MREQVLCDGRNNLIRQEDDVLVERSLLGDLTDEMNSSNAFCFWNRFEGRAFPSVSTSASKPSSNDDSAPSHNIGENDWSPIESLGSNPSRKEKEFLFALSDRLLSGVRPPIFFSSANTTRM
uniref:Uncharacterized protein n=1 Tax=Parascaris equorum TaxID=6256 RepID=A0A914REW1_PAREQ